MIESTLQCYDSLFLKHLPSYFPDHVVSKTQSAKKCKWETGGGGGGVKESLSGEYLPLVMGLHLPLEMGLLLPLEIGLHLPLEMGLHLPLALQAIQRII